MMINDPANRKSFITITAEIISIVTPLSEYRHEGSNKQTHQQTTGQSPGSISNGAAQWQC
jgi:hypothetical protein